MPQWKGHGDGTDIGSQFRPSPTERTICEVESSHQVNYTRSKALQSRAERVIPGGVNSPARAFKAVGGDPPFITRAQGAYMWDADGNRYIDYVGSWGPMILGHSHPAVTEALERAAREGVSFGASTPTEVVLAELVIEAFPSIEQVRFVNSGTEATMSAIRLARAVTGRKYIVKFEGCYHGHADALLVKGGSGLATLGVPDSAGVPPEFTQFTLSLPYNDTAALRAAFEQRGNDIACIIVEPVVGNMGCVPPARGFLEELRSRTTQYGALLIFDEVMTGFRIAFGGAQERFHIAPDITTLGKILGGGLPVGAYGASRDIMKMVSPLGPMYQAGTLSGNPLAMAAGIATLTQLRKDPAIYPRLEAKSEKLVQGVAATASAAGVTVRANRVGSMFTWFFSDAAISDWSSASTSDTKRYASWHRAMLERGIYLPPSQYEAAFMSDSHTDAEIQETIAAAGECLCGL